VSDAWIYGGAGGETTSRLLAELGFSPHRVAANGTRCGLKPSSASSLDVASPPRSP